MGGMIRSGAVTAESPLNQRLLAYFAERFPLANHGLLIVSYYSSNQFLAQILENPGQPVHYSRHTLLGAITLFCMFLHLRVFDEHKDYEDDLKHYPQRVLSRGIVSLGLLKIVGALAIGTELVLAVARGWAALGAVLPAVAFSLLMLKEFFVGGWLRRHFLIYAVSHLLIMPLFALVAYSFTTGKFPWAAPAWFWLYALVGLFVTCNWEISRKIRAPADELPGVESYSKIFGTYGAAYLVLLVRVIDTGLVALVGLHLGLGPFFYLALILLFLVCLIGILQFRFRTSTKTAKRLETYAGIYIVAFDLLLAGEIVHTYSLTL